MCQGGRLFPKQTECCITSMGVSMHSPEEMCVPPPNTEETLISLTQYTAENMLNMSSFYETRQRTSLLLFPV